MTGKFLTVFAFFLSLPIFGQTKGVDYCSYGDHTRLILVDRTTSYDDLDKRVFATGLSKIVDGFETGDRVIIHAITADFVQGEREFDGCVPGCPKKGLLDWLFSDCRDLVARADRTKFVRDLAINARGLLDNPREFPRSDIARSIARVTSSISNSVDLPNANLRDIYVFSDLIENSTELPWPAIVDSSPQILVERLRGLGVRPELAGAKIRIFGFGRFHDKERTPLQPSTEAKIRDFWMLYLTDGGASQINIEQRLE